MLSILLRLIVGREVLFKHSNTDMYICSISTQAPNACEGIASAGKYRIIPKEDGKTVIVDVKVNKVFSIADFNRLILWPQHGGPNQLFEIRNVDIHNVLLVNRDRCVTFNPNKKTYTYETCSTSKEQGFVMMDSNETGSKHKERLLNVDKNALVAAITKEDEEHHGHTGKVKEKGKDYMNDYHEEDINHGEKKYYETPHNNAHGKRFVD